jgi:hypothetical protein
MELILVSHLTHLTFLVISEIEYFLFLLLHVFFFFLLFIFIFKFCLLSSTVCVLKKCHFLFSFQFKRTLGQFTPAQWDKDEWHPLLGPWRFIQVLTLCIIFLTVELNTFFLKFCLWIPPRNPVIVYRLILWWLIAIPTIREYNSYLQDRYSLSLSLPTCSHERNYYFLNECLYYHEFMCNLLNFGVNFPENR